MSITIQITQEDNERVALAEKIFDGMTATLAREGVEPEHINIESSPVPIRAIQAALKGRQPDFDRVGCVILGIVEESNTMLPVAIESADQKGIESALGGILLDLCLICSLLNLDFVTIANEFKSSSLQTPESDALIALYKTVGMLASVAMHVEVTPNMDDVTATRFKLQFGCVLTKLCSAVHWLAFSNDMDIATLMLHRFEEVMPGKLAEKDPSN